MNFHRLFQFLMAILLVMALIPMYQAPPAAKAQEGGTEITRDTPYVPGELIVAFAPGSNAEQNAAVMDLMSKTYGLQPVRSEAETMLLRGDAGMDVKAAAELMAQMPGVAFAEPNYIMWLPEPNSLPEGATHDTEFVYRKAPEKYPRTELLNHGRLAVASEALQSMQTTRSGEIQAVYPNDDYLWWNDGWSWVGADIVSSNTTASANVCVIDTGVDYLHKDLSGKVIKGWDYVSDDGDPMDDNGHGTHVAGVIAAVKGNSEGIAGVSTGKVVAVKALTAQGWGTYFDIANAINYCANRTDIKVINMSLGGSGYSNMLETAVAYAVNVKGKLLVAAAGNDSTSAPHYPAYFAAYSPYYNKVLAVAASGYWQYDPDWDEYWLDYDCMADYSNYGSWISVVAPGTDIYSLLPWDRPFYLAQYYNTRYDYLSGTSMATPFVAASAARRWGYSPTAFNSDVGYAVINSGWSIDADGTCWPASMAGKHAVNVADLLDRGGAYAYAYDASAGTPLNGATVYIYRGATNLGSGIITAYTSKASPTSTDPTRVYTYYTAWTDIINLPTGGTYWPKINKSGYTASPQWAFDDWGGVWIDGGEWSYGGTAMVPPKNANFDLVLDSEASSEFDFDLNVWLPYTPNPIDPAQPAPFIVGAEGNSFGYYEGDPSGVAGAFPYARLRFGGFDYPPAEDTLIKKRSAHGPVPSNGNVPYYAGTYEFWVTDYGQTYDHDGDGCGSNYGYGWSSTYNPAADPDCPPNDPSGTLGRSLLWYAPRYDGPVSVFLWKDGVIKVWNSVYDTCGTTASWWQSFTAESTASSSMSRPNYYYYYACGGPGIVPYAAAPFSGRVEISR
jgi:subtilisin family serine protease